MLALFLDITVFIKALFLGLAIAAPVGPIALVCVRYTLNHNLKAGFAAGLGAACADAIYATLAGFGVVLIFQLLKDHSTILKLVAGGFLLFLGMKDLITHHAPKEPEVNKLSKSVLSIFSSTFLLTLTNPMTILLFLWVFSTLGAVDTSAHETWSIILGIFGGSLLWWLLLTSAVGYTKKKIPDRILKMLNYASGIILIMLGIGSIVSIIL
jgi:threonine/homoserine/homoserine lactone efflux protein